MPYYDLEHLSGTFEAATVVKDELFLHLNSLFTLGLDLWTADNLEGVHQRFASKEDETPRTFWEKLADEFETAPPLEKQLFAELYYVHILGPSNISGPTKRADMQRLLADLGGVSVPPVLDAGLEHGVASGGMAVTTGKYWQIIGLLDVMQRWVRLSEESRTAKLADPWAFRSFVVDTEVRGDAQRNLLLYLIHPETFEPIASKYAKSDIAAAFGKSEEPNVDRALFDIRQKLGSEYGDSGFHGANLRPLWDKKSQPNDRVSSVWKLLRLDDNHSQGLISALVQGIQSANAANVNGWEMGITQNRIRLNCGQNACFTISRDEVQMAISSSSIGAETQEQVGEFDTGEFARPDDVRSLQLSRGQAEALLEHVLDAYVDACSRSAASVSRTGFYKSHDPELLNRVAAHLGEQLDQPGYVTGGIPAPEPGPSTDRNAWLVRPGRADDDQMNSWLAEGYCAIGWDEVGFVAPGTPRDEIRARVRAAFPDDSENRVGVGLGNIDRFVNQVEEGDLVVAPRDQDIHVGIVTSEPRWEDLKYGNRRNVHWATAQSPIARGDLSRKAYSKLKTLLTVTDLSEVGAEFATKAGISDVRLPPTAERVHLEPVSKSQAAELLLPDEWLNEVIDMLRVKQQLIFVGPPGTGKTFVAQALGEHLTGGDRTTLVQFHPSYTYEDFVEGFRPQVQEDGSMRFELVPGPLKVIAEAARQDPSSPYVLIVDEINRANLPKVFGELYFLLEYREQAVTLQYSSDDTFTLPDNLFVIGTMNTADRSIALVDAAMRRRFYFVPFMPGGHPIDGLLTRWLAREGIDSDADTVLRLMNDRIGDDNYSIGPSYLIGSAGDEDAMERVWEHAILPLLEEHFIGTGRDVRGEFSLEALRLAAALAITEEAIVEG